MKRVYTDERFPDAEVVNFGGTEFLIFRGGQPIDAFTSYETESEQVSEPFAQRRASDYFNRIATHAEEPGQEPEAVGALPPLPAGVTEDSPVPQQIVGCLLDD